MGYCCVHELVTAQASRTPDAVAVIDDSGAQRAEMTYRELERRANGLANLLRVQGVRREDRVGVCLHRGSDLVVTLLAVLRSGGAYVPLDPDYPADRLAMMLTDSGARVVITSEDLAARFLGRDCATLIAGAGSVGHADDPGVVVDPESPAYVMYTSGSTGRPKGVVVPHAGVVNRILWGQEEFGMRPGERLLQKTPFGFDVSVPELFWPLGVGGTVVMARPGGHRDAGYLAQALAELRITTVHFVPSMLRAFLAEPTPPLPHLRRVLCSGEALTADLVAAVHERIGCPVHNLYGPTEASIEVTAALCVPGAPVTIGTAITNTVAHVLDDDLMPVPAGTAGQLGISGRPVTRGYHRQPGLTAERFVPNPHGAPGERLYLTGDLVRRGPDGSIDYLGRLDQQVKVRGNRVELGEIETALAADPHVSAAAVTVHTGQPGEQQLVAHLVPVGNRVDVSSVRARLARTLPDYMLPTAWLTLTELPLTQSGKVDRAALPTPSAGRPDLGGPYLAPRNKTERQLAEIWESVLGITPVGVRDCFLELGGQSLAATRVCARVRQTFEVALSADDLLGARTIEGLAGRVDTARGDTAELPHVPVLTGESGEYALSFAQQGIWLLEQLVPGGADYNMFESFELRGRLDVGALRMALADTVARHPALRTTFRDRRGTPVQVIAEDVAPPFTTLAVAPEAAAAFVQDEVRRPLSLDTGPLLRMTVLELGADHHLVVLVIHHIVADDWSMTVLWRDLCASYRARTGGGPAMLPALPVRYVDYAAWQRRHLSGPTLDDRLAYWRGQLDGAPLRLDLPTDHPRAERRPAADAVCRFELPAELATAVTRMSEEHGVTRFMTLFTVFAANVAAMSGQDDFLVGTFAGNRSLVELEDLVGLFVNILPIRVRPRADDRFADLLADVSATALGAYRHQELQFDKVVAAVRAPRDLTRNPLVQVGFQSLGTRSTRVDLPGVRSEPRGAGQGGNPFDLLVVVREDHPSFAGELHYRGDLFTTATARRFVDSYVRLTEVITADPARRLTGAPGLVASSARARG